MTNKQAKLLFGFDLNRNYTIEEIIKRYRELMKMNHPDMHVREDEKSLSLYNKKAIMINEAYKALKSGLNDDKVEDEDFIFMKNRALNEMRSTFEKCSDGVLKQSIENAYNKNIFIEDCSDYAELDSMVEKFYSILKLYYKSYEVGFRRQNGIPKKYEFSMRYDCSTDEFIHELDVLSNSYESYIDNKINGIIYTYFNIGDSVILSSYLDNRMDGIKYLLHNYNLFDYEEERAFDDFRDFIKETYDYYATISIEYDRIKRLIDKLPGNYDDSKCIKSKLLSKLNDSVYKRNFDSICESLISYIVSLEDKEKGINKLHKYLNMKSFLILSRLKTSKDKSRLNYVYYMMNKCTDLLQMASEGKYSLKDISILENITFTDENTDKMILSMLNNEKYSIYFRVPHEESDRLYNPFVLKSSNDEFLVPGEEVSLMSSEEIRQDSDLFSLSDIVTYGTPIFRYTSDGETVDNVLYQYNGYELVCNYDAYDGTINDFYLTGMSEHKGYDYSNKFDIKEKVAYKVQSMFRPFTKKIQKKNKGKKLIRINNI